MKITLVIHSLAGGGAERVMAGLASQLALRGHQITLVTLDDGLSDRHQVDSSVSRVFLKVMSTAEKRVSFWHRLRRLRQSILDDGGDVVLSFCDATNWLVLMATVGLSVPVVVSERSDPARQSLGRSKESMRGWLYRRAASVICLTEPIARTLANQTGVTPVVIASAVQPMPITWRVQREEYLACQQAADDLKIVAIGRLESEKGFDRLLRCLAKLNEVPWRLEVLGEGTQRESLEALSRQLGIDPRVCFRGWVQPVWETLARADLFVLPSRYEGAPSALLEAMAAGVAVVATDIGGGVTDVIRNERTGLIVANAESALGAGIERLAQDRGLRMELATAAAEVVERFSWEKMVFAYERVLKQASQPR